ncbi:MAG TPA: amino acid adenylation domain-containing protein, partial [Rhizobacter sp.]|nr:amino acid adenylation domain-containing protein [Rhizobacter sp.]
GHCVNLLPIRVAVDATQPFNEFVGLSGGALLDAFDHQTLTYGSLLTKLPVHRDPSRLPLVSVMFNVDQAVSSDASSFPDLSIELTANARRFENFELFVNAAPVDGGFRLECQYNTDLFDAVTIERLLAAYETLLRSATRQPSRPIGQLEWLAPADLSALAALQPVATPLVAANLMHSAFVWQSEATPQSVALRHGSLQLSYQELDERSNSLARALRSRGVRRGERVGLCISRGIDMVVSMLAVMKAGGTYVPLDPGFPEARLAYYAEDARLALLLTESTMASAPTAWRADAGQRVLHLDLDTAWQQESAEPLTPSAHDATGEDAAYIIYTSGSTGKPKGVCVPHRAVANFLASMARQPGITAQDRLAAVTTLSFDIAVLELMLPLTVGAQVIVVPRDTAMDGNLLRALLDDSGATQMQATPGLWRMLLDTDWRGGAGFKALIGGESCPPDLAFALLDRVGELWNMYGPTETTVWSSVWRVERDQVMQRGMSIGRPIDNTTVWILDERKQACPVGVPGEICIGGSGVALGYLDRPELTADRFIADPFNRTPGALLYRTGDRGRWRNDGLLEHLGRLDFQVKVRG